jgi:lipopolysaccharide transport system ATP-binding protein
MAAAVSIQGVGKEFHLGEKSHDTLRDQIAGWFRRQPRVDHSSFWALRDVSFDVQPGEVIGIIGRNGAGKSTLLKILSQITDPTEGEVRIRGRVASLLEVGTGFHPELSGRENVFLNGAILGMSRQEIRARFDEIVAFAEVEKFIDTPVKHYSSGMYVRLAFAVAAHLEPEILIVDEVLAVGDAGFQKKCLGKIDAVSKEGRTVIFVSHQMDMIRALCSRCVLLSAGQMAFNGSPESAAQQYASEIMTGSRSGSFEVELQPQFAIQILRGRLLGPTGVIQTEYDVFEPIRLELEYVVHKPITGALVTARMLRFGATVFLSFDTDATPERLETRAPGHYKTTVTIPAPLLKPGSYTISLNTGIANLTPLHALDDILALTVELKSRPSTFLSYAEKRPGMLAVSLDWPTETVAPAPGVLQN